MERIFTLVLLVVVVFMGVAFAQDPGWLYEGISGKATWVGGPAVGFVLALLFLAAVMGALHYLRLRSRK